jgi:hypothetical protein
MVQLPVLMRVTVAEETPYASDWLPMAQDPVALVALKLTCNPLEAVAVTVGDGSPTLTELVGRLKVIVWSFLTTAGGDGGLWRCAEEPESGTRRVDIV